MPVAHQEGPRGAITIESRSKSLGNVFFVESARLSHGTYKNVSLFDRVDQNAGRNV